MNNFLIKLNDPKKITTMKYNLGLTLFSSKKGVGASRNGRDSAGRRLGAKAADSEIVLAGTIIYRQRGTKIHPGKNVGRGNDDTLYALIPGKVKYERLGKHKKQVSVYAVAN